ncbi:MAG: hypothetical protein K0R51_984 [Cytophagaceae bacterium]|jgi:hypothetical protein|nr:hypothetical protein [Cytophagaceae bacterium]
MRKERGEMRQFYHLSFLVSFIHPKYILLKRYYLKAGMPVISFPVINK